MQKLKVPKLLSCAAGEGGTRPERAGRVRVTWEAGNGRDSRIGMHASPGDAAPGRGLDRHDAGLARRSRYAGGDEGPLALAAAAARRTRRRFWCDSRGANTSGLSPPFRRGTAR